jgi:uncharacterized membrane protein
MSLHAALYELAAEHTLDSASVRRLFAVAGLDREPELLAVRVARGVAVLAAALFGLGVVMWIAANWDTLGRSGRFALLQAFVAVMGIGALARPGARAPLSLLALLGTGALFAYFGQTYQTGADAWQLFALWALLALPFALAARSDVVWAPWALVAMTAVSLWVYAHAGHRWQITPADLAVHAIGWGMALALVAALGPWLARFSGAGAWALRTAATLAVVLITATALGALLQASVAPHYWLALLLFAAAAVALALARWFDVFTLSAVALGLDTLLVVGLGRWLFSGSTHDAAGSLFLIGLFAAALLAASVSLVMRLSRRHGTQGALA